MKKENTAIIYHGSTIPNLKIINPKKSTQKGAYVYGTTNMLYAAIFSIIQKTDAPLPPKFGYNEQEIYLAERFPNQFDSIANISSYIYILDGKNFENFSDHSAGDDIEKRAATPQPVLQVIPIENCLDYIKQNNVKLYPYEEREKVGIPKDDKYMVQGILRTYLWKTEYGTEEDLEQGKEQIKQIQTSWPKYNELLDYFIQILDNLPEEEKWQFVENIYNKKEEKFNQEVIEQATVRIKSTQSSNKETPKTKKRIPTNDSGFSNILTLTSIISIILIIFVIIILLAR